MDVTTPSFEFLKITEDFLCRIKERPFGIYKVCLKVMWSSGANVIFNLRFKEINSLYKSLILGYIYKTITIYISVMVVIANTIHSDNIKAREHPLVVYQLFKIN